MRFVYRSLLALLFPRCCPLCGHAIADQDQPICHECMQHLPRTEQSFVRGNSSEEAFCEIKNFCRGASFMYYEKHSMIQNLFHKIKYHERPELGYYLAQEAARDFMQSDFFEGIDLIIPVPLHPKRLRERGYNQAEWIARGLSDVTHIPLSTTHLTRTHNNPQQAMIGKKDREENVANIFAVNHPEELYRKHILLVDDIITTGSTLKACIEACKPCRDAQFSVFALGKTQ